MGIDEFAELFEGADSVLTLDPFERVEELQGGALHVLELLLHGEVLLREPGEDEVVESGVGRDGIVPEVLHCGGAGVVAEGEPFEDVGTVVGLPRAKGDGVLHWLERDWADENGRDLNR